jgi:tetratricopeptide (TPR) repeat protein
LETDYGIRFADVSVATKFSYERLPSPNRTLGFHGLFNMHCYISRDELDAFLEMLSSQTLGTPEMTEFGLGYWRRGERDSADSVFRAIGVKSNRFDIRFLRERLKQGATLSSDTAESVNPVELVNRGVSHHKTNELAAAYQFYLLALMLDPNYAPALHLIGVIAAAGGQLDQAIALFRKAIRIDNAVAAYHTDLADALAAQSKLAEAIAHYGDALRLAPDDLSLHEKLRLAEKTARQTNNVESDSL